MDEKLKELQKSLGLAQEEFSLNDFAKKNNLSQLEFDIIKGYMDLDVDARKKIMATVRIRSRAKTGNVVSLRKYRRNQKTCKEDKLNIRD